MKELKISDISMRMLKLDELKIIQGFPEDFTIHGAWGEAMRQIGNAVPVAVGRRIGHEIAKIILPN